MTEFICEHGEDSELLFKKSDYPFGFEGDYLYFNELTRIMFEPFKAFTELLYSGEHDAIRPTLQAIMRDLKAGLDEINAYLENIGEIQFRRECYGIDITAMCFIPKIFDPKK